MKKMTDQEKQRIICKFEEHYCSAMEHTRKVKRDKELSFAERIKEEANRLAVQAAWFEAIKIVAGAVEADIIHERLEKRWEINK